MTASSRVCVIAAGGTGGHMFAAEALAMVMKARGWRIILATDKRGQNYAQKFPAEMIVPLEAATGSGVVGMIKAGTAIIKGVGQASTAFNQLGADVVVGFGGYPSAPALVAAVATRRPTVIHEQNAVLGKTNRFIAASVDTVASAFSILGRAPKSVADDVQVVGNPVRPDIRALFDRAYKAPKAKDPIHVVVTGGSQGARILSEETPKALAALPEELRKRLRVSQQARFENLAGARKTYQEAGIEAEVEQFFDDMANRLNRAHLVIGRSGAGTCSELAVAAMPSVLIPLKIATDDHQTLNAKVLVDAGAARTIAEDVFSAQALTQVLGEVLADPATLSAMSAAARSVAIPDAAERLADLVEATAAAR